MTHNLLIYSDGNVQVRDQFYRKPHDLEIFDYDSGDWRYMGDGYSSGPIRDTVINDPDRNPHQKPMPQVYRVSPEHPIRLECAAVRLLRDINHSAIGVNQISTMLNSNYAFSNNTGFPERYNCLTGENRGAKDPVLDTPRICGGAILKPVGSVTDRLYFDYIDVTKPLPTASDVIARPWLWFWVTSIDRNGRINIVTKLGQDGNYYPVRMPLFASQPLYLPTNWLHKLPMGFWPPSAAWMAIK